VGLPVEAAGVTSKLGHVTWTDLWNMAPRPIIAVPIGSCEQHGPHLPLDTDTRIAMAVDFSGRLALSADASVAGDEAG